MSKLTKKCVEKDCGKQFILTQEQIDFFKSKSFNLPKRCKECRARRKREINSPVGDVAIKLRKKTR